jgi:regulatory protein YycH of two-component signal transduction system YycFG
MKVLKASWNETTKAKREGMFVGLPWNILERERTETSEKVRILFKEWDAPYVIQGDDSAEDLLEVISEKITESETGKTDLELPDDSEDIYLIQFSDNLIVSVFVNNSYNGNEVEKYACIDGVIITEEITNGEVHRFVEWAKWVAK